MRNRKKHRSFKRKRRKHTSSRGVSEGLRTPPLVRTDEAVNREIEFVASLFVNQTTGPDGESEWDPEEDEEWVAYFEQRIQELEALQEAMQALPDEEIHRSLIRRGLEGERQQRVEQVIATIRRMCTEELESLPLALDAQKLRIALRDEVRTLCSRGSAPITRFIPIPPPACRKNLPSDDEQMLDRVTMTYCTEIWFMMADTYPEDCAVHLYLECPGGWYSAEVYELEEQAEQEAQRRKDSEEGTFEIRYFEESDSIVLFTKHKPRVVDEAPTEGPGE